MYFVYILICSDKTYYTGVTNDLERRLSEHTSGYDVNCYTYHRRPLMLLWNDCFANVSDALIAEKQIKGWGKKKKDALINGDFEILPELARGHTGYMNKQQY